ncbi:hypothetical protein GJAV_G00073590 [Gymnothorax javanicus]|nr:hypothetical protein GJAV_G00073590 [Gymnothorax javanicus]
MSLSADQRCEGMDLLDLLFDQNDGILRNEQLGLHGSQTWPAPQCGMPSLVDGTTDFLNALLGGNDSVPPRDTPCSKALPNPQTAEFDSSFNLDRSWPYHFFPDTTAAERPEFKPCVSSGFPLTVKDLLLSGTTEHAQQPSHQTCQELILNEDERKLLVKEGITLPNKLPLSKYEERILKKIRRKIRNKQSAQESRKKKKEYIDGLESRVAACNAQNQELQRKVFQLEKRNSSLMEQLRRLQAMVINGSNKTAQTGTCILVLLLSLSLILFPSLQPSSDSKVVQGGDFGLVRIQSRSLHNVLSSRVVDSPDHHSPVIEESQRSPEFAVDDGVKEITGLFAHSSLVPQNTSLDERDHHHGDPITGHIATVTWAARHDTLLRSYADDM